MEGYKPIEELKAYIDEYEAIEVNNTSYDKAYILAMLYNYALNHLNTHQVIHLNIFHY